MSKLRYVVACLAAVTRRAYLDFSKALRLTGSAFSVLYSGEYTSFCKIPIPRLRDMVLNR